MSKGVKWIFEKGIFECHVANEDYTTRYGMNVIGKIKNKIKLKKIKIRETSFLFGI